ncbi:zinc finger protein 615-like isoform X2 [Achroia grisella]|uniref:zinc finger protein 615-like isoform X2 n=1 Tax=Achroia grisella TaxID=688607 RepID=UPI0027D2960C|nr:zinc finger protein 615-like isoform X2 [Achroia grisella]
MDVSNLCRSCMKEVASWERDNFDPTAIEMFTFCTNIKVTDEDKLPRQFCYDCIIKIESSCTYIMEAQKVNVTLKNVVSRPTSVIVKPESHNKNIVNTTTDNTGELELSDYKLNTIDNFDEQAFFDNIDNQEENFSNCNKTEENDTNIKTIDNENSINVKEIENVEEAKRKEVVEDTNVNTIENEKSMNVKEMENVGETKKNVCPVCRKEFMSKVWFAKHMENEHTGNKYACTQCPKTFTKRSQLSYHETTHSEERQFECAVPTCGKRFKRRKQLVAHARAHADARPYSCDKCNMRFKIKSILKCHMKVHEEQKQYLCCFCGWSFTQATAFSRQAQNVPVVFRKLKSIVLETKLQVVKRVT